MNVVVNGLMTNYSKVGKERVVVCLPGWGDSTTAFDKLANVLKETYTVLSLDLPGFGGSQAPSQAWSLEDYANFTRDWLKKINVGKVYAIVSHSYGGSIAIAGIGDSKLDCERLVLLASAGVRDNKVLKRKTVELATKIAKYPTLVLPRHYRRKLRHKVYESVGSDMLLLPRMEQTFKMIIREDVRPRARLINVPTLLIYGSKDDQTPVSYGRLLTAAIAGSNLEIIQGAGHFLLSDSAEQVSKLVKEFLNNDA